MRPERNARRLLGITSAKAKMWEYKVPKRYHIEVDDDPTILFDLAIGAVGDLSATICGEGFITENQLSDLRSTLKFASQFFDSFSNSKLNTAIDPFSYLCASSSFYLCDIGIDFLGSPLCIARYRFHFLLAAEKHRLALVDQ